MDLPLNITPNVPDPQEHNNFLLQALRGLGQGAANVFGRPNPPPTAPMGQPMPGQPQTAGLMGQTGQAAGQPDQSKRGPKMFDAFGDAVLKQGPKAKSALDNFVGSLLGGGSGTLPPLY